jgi:hypothetical protein
VSLTLVGGIVPCGSDADKRVFKTDIQNGWRSLQPAPCLLRSGKILVRPRFDHASPFSVYVHVLEPLDDGQEIPGITDGLGHTLRYQRKQRYQEDKVPQVNYCQEHGLKG